MGLRGYLYGDSERASRSAIRAIEKNCNFTPERGSALVHLPLALHLATTQSGYGYEDIP